jgi:5'(3')-deoxyribonucleotidase
VKPVLALDFDDVIFPFMHTFVPHYNENYQAEFSVEDYHTFEFHEVWGGTRERAFDVVGSFFHRPHDGIAPMPGAIEGVNELARHFDLVIVTARDESLRVHTEKWLQDAFPNVFSQVFLCNSYVLSAGDTRRTKIEVVEAVNAVGLVDDSLHHTSQVAEAGRLAILFGDYAWNRTEVLPEGVIRSHDWPHIVESLVTSA